MFTIGNEFLNTYSDVFMGAVKMCIILYFHRFRDCAVLFIIFTIVCACVCCASSSISHAQEDVVVCSIGV
jgi:hypothetical protein